MIPLVSRQVARALDAEAIEGGTASLTLMENAGGRAFDAILEHFPGALSDVVVVGGTGQNGGDGWVVARLLIDRAERMIAVLVGDPGRLTGDARATWEALGRVGGERIQVGAGALAALDVALERATLVVDALFGTGLDREVGGVHAEVIAKMNACPAPKVSLDVPSGVDADTGAVLGAAVDATLTVTFAAHKRGLWQHPGARLRGEVLCVPIGVEVPEPGADGVGGVIEAHDVAAWLGTRAPDTHKGQAGHVLVIAGAPGRTGAALLAGLGALRTGAGLVTLAPRAGARAALDAKVVELMTAELPADANAAVAALVALAADKDAAVIGPGLGTDAAGVAIAEQLATELALPAVVDADALTASADDLGALGFAPEPRVLTPHPGEAARLLACTPGDVQRDRHAAATRIAEASRSVVVLKGAGTIVADPSGRHFVCSRGTPAMATAGVGDVLAGAIAALLPGRAPFEAACAAVYLHAVAGEIAARADRGLLASELAAALPDAVRACRSGE
jgi:NAD(P)H-hydrate epimerase